MSNSDKLIAVIGVTGQQGGATARHLLAKGFKVRGLARDPQKPAAQALAESGAEIVYADNYDVASLQNAFAGADGVFSAVGFWEGGPEGELQQGKNIADAAKAAGVKHFVYSSVDGAERNSGIPHFESKWGTEQYVRELGLPVTILRPVEFMENYNWAWNRTPITNGTLMAQVRPSRKRLYVSVDDVGAFAAIVFEHPEEYIGKEFSIAGDGLTEPEIAETLGRVIGRPVQLTQPPFDPLAETGDPQRDDLVKMTRWFDEYGYQADIPHLRSVYPPLQDFETWLRNNGWENAEPMPMDQQGAWS